MSADATQSQVNQVLDAITALHSSPDASVRQQADAFVTQYQQSVTGWRISDLILQRHSLSPQQYFTAAQTLRRKVENDIRELADPSARFSFRDCLVQHILRFSTTDHVRIHLSLALAGLAVHMCEEWPEIPQWLFSRFQTSPPVLLEIFSCLAEQVNNQELKLVDRDRQARASNLFTGFFPQLLSLLVSALSGSGNDRKLQRKIFDCFHYWLRFGKLSANDLARCTLVTATFDALQQIPDLFDVCMDTACQLVRNTSDVDAYAAVVNVIVPRCLSLISQFDTAIAQSDDEKQKAFTRLFTEMGDAYLVLIVNGYPQGQAIVDALIKCVSLKDKSTVALTFRFWYFLSKKITSSNIAANSDGARSTFTPSFTLLIDRLRVAIAYTKETESWNSSDLDDFKQFRHMAADTMLDAAGVLGGTACLNLIFEQLKVQCDLFSKSAESWHGLEASLHCVRSIARRVDLNEHYVMPQIMDMLPMLSRTKISFVRYTAALMVGRYADWINLHPKYLVNALGFVLSGLSDHKEVVSASTLAFKHICDGCTAHLTGLAYFPELLKVYNASVALPLIDQKDIIEGICFVISALPTDQITKALHSVLVPVVNDINACLSEQLAHNRDKSSDKDAISVPKELEERIIVQLERLAHVFCAIDPKQEGLVGRATNASLALSGLNPPPSSSPSSSPSPSPSPTSSPTPLVAPSQTNRSEELERTRAAIVAGCVELLGQLWPILDASLKSWKGNDRLMERLCKVWRFGVKTTQLAFEPFLIPLVKTLSDLFTEHPHSCFIYVAAICVDVFGPHERFHQTLIGIFTVFVTRVLSLLPDQQSFVNRPEVVEDFYDLMSRFLKRSPLLIVKPDNAMLLQVVERSLFGVSLDEKDAFTAVMQFYCDLFSRGYKGDNFEPTPLTIQTVTLVVQNFGFKIVSGLLAGVAGDLPHTRVKNIIHVFDDLLSFTGPRAQSLFVAALATFPETRDPDKSAFLQQLMTGRYENIRNAVYAWETAIRKLS